MITGISLRKLFLKRLKERGVIGRIIWDKPLSYFFKNDCKNAKEISERIVGIPINANYSEKDAKSLAKIIKNSLKQIGKS
jgi:dTDP-4-amino-4,6-dideoxygalactose transaminase